MVRRRGVQLGSSIFWRCGSIPGSLSTRGSEGVEPEWGFPFSVCCTAECCRVGLPHLHCVARRFGTPTHQFKVLGIPLGNPDFVQPFLEGKIAEPRVLLERIPEVPDTQSAWLLLSFCAAARANFLRGVNPDHAKWFAAAHDQGVWQCFCRIMQILPTCGLKSCRRCQYERAGSDFGVHVERSQQPTGQVGLTHSKWWRNATRLDTMKGDRTKHAWVPKTKKSVFL